MSGAAVIPGGAPLPAVTQPFAAQPAPAQLPAPARLIAPDSAASAVGTPSGNAAAPVAIRRRFRPARAASRLSGDEAAREGRIVRIAFARLGSEAARVFLNTPHATLGGRPLDLATATADGAVAVEQAIAALPDRSASPTGSDQG